MIDRLRSIALIDDNVLAVFMYGSFTKNEGDAYSDIEFYVFLKEMVGFSGEKWVSQIHPVAMYFTNEYGSEVAIFENLIRGEFHFMSSSEMNVILSWEGVVDYSAFDRMNLVDKEGCLSAILNQIKVTSPDRATGENILWLGHSLLNSLLTSKNLMQRGEWAHAHQNMCGTQKYLLWLIRIATQQTGHWESPTKCLEKDLDSVWYDEFKSTISDLDPDRLGEGYENAKRIAAILFDELKIPNELKDLLHRM